MIDFLDWLNNAWFIWVLVYLAILFGPIPVGIAMFGNPTGPGAEAAGSLFAFFWLIAAAVLTACLNQLLCYNLRRWLITREKGW